MQGIDEKIARRAAGAWGLAAVVLAVLAVPGPARGQNPDETAVQSGKEAFDSGPNFPWYDSQGDTIQRVNVRPTRDLRNRHSRWESAPWQLPPWIGQILEIAAWTLLAALLAMVVMFMVRAFLSYERGTASAAAAADTVLAGEVDRVEGLPFQLPERRVSLLDEARRLYEAGNYSEAIVYLYSYQLIQLDKEHLIRLARGKTNRQYLREMRPLGTVRSLLERTMIAFEDAFFGNHALDRSRFEACWKALDDFHRQVQQAGA